MIKYIKSLLFTTILFGCVSTQASTNDFLSLDRVGISLKEEFRFRDTGQSFFYQFTELGISYEINNYLDVFTKYRLIFKEKNGLFDDSNVLLPGINLKYPAQKWGKVSMEVRGEAGLDFNPIPWVLNVHPKYNTPWKWTKFEFNPYVSDEMFFDASHDLDYLSNRVRVGMDYKFTKGIKGSTGYYYEANEEKGTHANVVNTSIKFEF